METTDGGWTIIDRDAGVLSSTYEFSKGATSNTFAARLPDGTMMVVSPSTNLTDQMADELTAFGDVSALVANNGLHHLGQAAWRARFVNARCFAPTEACARIPKKNKDAGTFEPLSQLLPLLGDDVGAHEVPNTKVGESWYWAKVSGGYVWYPSDILANMSALPSSFIPRQLFKWTDSAPGYKVFGLALKFAVKDKSATLRSLLDAMEARPPIVIVPAHGDILTQDGLLARTRTVIEAAI